MGIKVVTGNRYLEGFIREREEEKIWMDGKVAGWAESVDVKTYSAIGNIVDVKNVVTN